MHFVGIDIAGEKKGQSVAVMDRHLRLISLKGGERAEGLPERIVQEFGRKIIVAIDAPRQPSIGLTGKWGRLCEREIQKECQVRPQWTPDIKLFEGTDDRRKRYEWMEIGFNIFEGFLSCIAPNNVIEVFPSASYGNFPPKEVKTNFALFNPKHKTDQLDAICAALTAWYFWNGQYRAIGDPIEGQIIVPKKRVC